VLNEAILLTIYLINIIILTIITILSIEGYILLREKNTKLLSLAFFFLILGSVFSITSWPFMTGVDSDTNTSVSLISYLLNILAIVVIVYAFYQNKNYNQIVLKRSHWLIIILASLLTSWLLIIYIAQTVWAGNWNDLVNVHNLLRGVTMLVIPIPLIALLVMLTKYYRRTKNTNTLFIISGFSAIFLIYAFPGVFLASFIVSVFSWDFLPIAQGLIALIAYLSFLIALIRTRLGA
jgi:hypothetical protein